jgi:ATP-dependent helicase/DNAse subunit B
MDASIPRGLTLVLGPANSGKMGLVLDWWQERAGLGTVVVAPTAPDAWEIALEMVERAGAIVGESPAMTFDGLVRMVLRRVPRYAGELETTLLLRKILRDESLEALAPAAESPGTVTALGDLLRQLRETGKDEGEIERILARWIGVDPHVSGLAGDIRRLAAGYARNLAALGLEDRPGAVREAVAVLGEAGAVSNPRWVRPVALYGFTSFTPGQRLLVEALSRQVEVLLAFTYDESRDVNLVSAADVGWWRRRAARVVDAPSSTRAYASPAIDYLERHFMGERNPPAPPRPADERGGVHFLLSSGKRAEVELVAEHVAELLREGFRPRDIALVARGMNQFVNVVRHVFQSCGIPVRVDERRTLDQTGLGHAFLAGLKGVVLDDAAAVLAYLRSPYSGVAPEEVSDLELLYRRGTATGAEVLRGVAGKAGVPGVEKLWEVAGSSAGLQTRPAKTLVRRMLVEGSRGAAVGNEELDEDGRTYEALLHALDALDRLDSQGLSGGKLQAVFGASTILRTLSGLGVGGAIDRGEDAVQVLSVQRARARRFPVVAILGLVDGEFPSRTQGPSFLSPSQRERLNRVEGGLFPAERDEESAWFVSAVSRASKLLLLSAREAEDDGTQVSPSYFWEISRRLLCAGETDRACRTLADQVFLPSTAPSWRHYLRACAARGLSPKLGTGVGAQSSPPRWERRQPELRSEAVLCDLASTDRFSPSALESYLRCPFTWFVERVVRAEDMDYELDKQLFGQMLHSVLSATYRRLNNQGLLPLRLADFQLAQEVASEEIDRTVWNEDYPGTVAERRLAGTSLRRLTGNLFEMETAAAPATRVLDTEVWVGGKKGVDIGGLRIVGRIDRMDVTTGGQGVFVLDYKSGSIPTPAELGTEKGLQLPLYLLAAMNECPNQTVLGGAYLSLGDKKRCGVVAAGAECHLNGATEGYRVLDDAAAEELFSRTREAARQAVEGIRAGLIAPRPDRQCPSWCKLGPACRARRGGYRQ